MLITAYTIDSRKPLEWVQMLGGGESWWYLVDDKFKVYAAQRRP